MILSIPITKIASATVQIIQAATELNRKVIFFIEDKPAMKGIKGLIAGTSRPITIPPQPYLLKNFSPFKKTSSLLDINWVFLIFGPKKSPV